MFKVRALLVCRVAAWFSSCRGAALLGVHDGAICRLYRGARQRVSWRCSSVRAWLVRRTRARPALQHWREHLAVRQLVPVRMRIVDCAAAGSQVLFHLLLVRLELCAHALR